MDDPFKLSCCRWHLGCCHEDYLPTSRGFDSFSGLYHGWGEHFLHTYDTNVGGGPDGYDFHDGLNNNIAANNTYSTVRSKRLLSATSWVKFVFTT